MNKTCLPLSGWSVAFVTAQCITISRKSACKLSLERTKEMVLKILAECKNE